MSAGKVIGNVIIFGGIGAMAYLLFKKPKTTPIITKPAGTFDFQPNAMDIMCAEKNPTPYTDVNLYNRCLENYKSKSEVWKPLIDKNAIAMVSDPINYNSYSAIYRSLYLPTGDLKANTCGDLDIASKGIINSLQTSYKLAGAGLNDQYKPIIAIQEKAKKDIEDKFNKFNCRDKIEAERTKTLVDLQTKGSIKAEETIVNKGFTEQKTYIILGALVLLTGFYVVVKK